MMKLSDDEKLMIGVAVGVGLLLFAGGRGGKATVASNGLRYPDWSKDAVIRAIYAETARRGYPIAAAQGLQVNAFAESELDPWEVGDSGNAVGLYQMWASFLGGGFQKPLLPAIDPPPHRGWDIGVPQPTDPRCDPTAATGLMCDHMDLLSQFRTWKTDGSLPASWWAQQICFFIEQPKDPISAAVYRAGLAKDMFGG